MATSEFVCVCVDKDEKLSPEEMRAGLSHMMVKCPNSRCCYRGSTACLSAPGVSSCKSSVDFCTFRKFFLLLPQVSPFHCGIFLHLSYVSKPGGANRDASITVLYSISISTWLLSWYGSRGSLFNPRTRSCVQTVRTNMTQLTLCRTR